MDMLSIYPTAFKASLYIVNISVHNIATCTICMDLLDTNCT